MVGNALPWSVAVTLALLAGCAAGPPAQHPMVQQEQDVEFVRGCWVAKDLPGGPPTAFLRLLPDGAGGSAYAGSVIDVHNGRWNPGVRYAFARDGSRAFVTDSDGATRTYLRTNDGPSPAAADGAARIVYTDGRQLLMATGGSDTLVIRLGVKSPITIWPFERDGCD